MNLTVLATLIPVILLVVVGFGAAKATWLRPDSTKDLSTVVFMLFTPALMFRTMSTVHLEQLDLRPIVAYFAAAITLYAAVVLARGLTRRAAAMAISATFGNTVAIGIPLVGLAYGERALVTLFTIVAVHALILLTLSTVVFELAVVKEQSAGGHSDHTGASAGGPPRHAVVNVFINVMKALRNGLVHPATTPTLLGLAFAQTGWVLPAVVDRTLQLMALAMGPLALILVGAALAGARVGAQIQPALALTFLKNLLLPVMVAAAGWWMGLSGVTLTVMVVAAAMPTGANAFMFAQRYNVAQELVTATVALSTSAALVTVSLVMALLVWWL